MTHSINHEVKERLFNHAIERQILKVLQRIDGIAKSSGVEPKVFRQYLKPFLQKMPDKHF